MPKPTGPRRQVLARREREAAAKVKEGALPSPSKLIQKNPPPALPGGGPASLLKVKPVHTSARALQTPAPVSFAATQTPNLHIHSSSVPVLTENELYTINVAQNISYDDKNEQAQQADQSNLRLQKKFIAPASKSTLDESLIHSVYPPPGHSDYWNTLPHVLFIDPETPWLFESPFKPGDPWLALVVFTHDELYLPSSTLDSIASTVKPAITTLPLTQTTNLSISMTNTQFHSLVRSSAAPLGTGNAWGSAQTQAIFITPDLYQAIMPRDQKNTPWLMSHVRTIDPTGMSDMDASDNGTYAVTVSQRTGPLNPSTPTAVYAHLVVIPGIDDSGKAVTNTNLIGLCSLYSWSYTCLPTTGLSVTKLLQDLGDSVQPLRLTDQSLADATPQIAPWMSNRLKAGYSLGRYRPLTGEVTMCIFRGMLMPESPFSEDAPPSSALPSSDFGSDLAAIDRDSGLIDVTYHMAWTLGRSLAISDRSFSAALMRVRNSIHNEALKATKQHLDKLSPAPVYKSISDAVAGLSSSSSALKNMAFGKGTSNFKSRWNKPATRSSTRDVYSFAHDEVKEEYKKAYRMSAFNIAAAASPDPHKTKDVVYDETSPPASTDWGTIFSWVMDKWYLGGIPMLNLIPDPSFVPKESIRTFYIDPNWLRSLFDGALSIAMHQTNHDEARDAIKGAFDTYLASNEGSKPHPPQLPRFGLFLRSELVKKYPNLHISAPFPNNDQDWQHVDDTLRIETIDQDLLLVLFDRIPGAEQFPNGITVQPPGHQLSFSFGNDTWTFSDTEHSVREEWRNVMIPQYNSYPHSSSNDDQATSKYTSTAKSMDARGFDFQYSTLLPADLGADAFNVISVGSVNDPLSSLLGAQFITRYPKLQIMDAATVKLGDPSHRPLPRLGWTCTVDSEEAPYYVGSNVFDGDPISHWHTEWISHLPGHPHTIIIDMKQTYNTGGLTYLPRQDGNVNGTIGQYEIFALYSGTWDTFSTGTWADDTTLKTVKWDDFPTQYIKLTAYTEAGNRGNWTSAAEINILGGGALPRHSLQTSTRAPYQKFPPLAKQDVRPTVSPPSAIPSASPLSSPSYTPPPSLLQLLANTVVTDPSEYNRYVAGAIYQSNIPLPNPGWLRYPSYEYFPYTLVSDASGYGTTYKVLTPSIPSYPLDLYFAVHLWDDSNQPDATRILEKIEIKLPYGRNTTTCFLAPMPTYTPSNNPGTPKTALSDPYVDAPHQNPIQGVKVPNIRFLGIGQRYTASLSLIGIDYGMYQVDGQLLVTIAPILTPSQYTSDIEPVSANPDLSFRIEGVGVNGVADDSNPGKYTGHILKVTEYYSRWKQSDGSDPRAEVEIMSGTYCVGATY